MTIDEVAAALDGREYGDEVRTGEAAEWAAAGIVVAYGAGDDLLEFFGAITSKIDLWNGASVRIYRSGVLDEDEYCDEYGQAALTRAKKSLPFVVAEWCPPGESLSWDVSVTWDGIHDLPSARFLIVEDGEPFCRGVVFRSADVPAPEDV